MPTTGYKRTFVLSANEALVGTLMTIGDVNDIFPIKLSPLVNDIVLKILINVGVKGRKKACTSFYCFLSVMNVWKGFKIRVKIMEIKSAEIKATFH